MKKRAAIGISIAIVATIAMLPLGAHAIQNIFTDFGKVTDIAYGNTNIDKVVYQDTIIWERCIPQTRFDYTGNYQVFTAECAGDYKIETWGASGSWGLGDGAPVQAPGEGGYADWRLVG